MQERTVYRGRVVVLTLQTVDGRTRELIRHPGSVSILPVDGDEIYLIREYRFTVGDFLWEIPAGTLEENESPEECAARELEEETGLRAGRIEKMFEAYLVPGYGTEKMHFFLATELTEGKPNPEPSERIEVHKLKISEVLDMIRRNEIVDAKTIASILFYLNLGPVHRR